MGIDTTDEAGFAPIRRDAYRLLRTEGRVAAQAPLRAALREARRDGDKPHEARLLHELGLLWWRSGCARRAAAALERAQAMYAAALLPRERAGCLMALARLRREQGDVEDALRSYVAAYRVHKVRHDLAARRECAAEMLAFAPVVGDTDDYLVLSRNVGFSMEEISEAFELGWHALSEDAKRTLEDLMLHEPGDGPAEPGEEDGEPE